MYCASHNFVKYRKDVFKPPLVTTNFSFVKDDTCQTGDGPPFLSAMMKQARFCRKPSCSNEAFSEIRQRNNDGR